MQTVKTALLVPVLIALYSAANATLVVYEPFDYAETTGDNNQLENSTTRSSSAGALSVAVNTTCLIAGRIVWSGTNEGHELSLFNITDPLVPSPPAFATITADFDGSGIEPIGIRDRLQNWAGVAAAYDARAGDEIRIVLKDAVTNTPIGTPITPIVTTSDTASDWTTLGPFDLSEANDTRIHLEFHYQGSNNLYIGLYIDDVTVTP